MRTRLWISIILLWVVWAAVKPLAAPAAQSVLWQIEHISPEYAYPDGAYGNGKSVQQTQQDGRMAVTFEALQGAVSWKCPVPASGRFRVSAQFPSGSAVLKITGTGIALRRFPLVSGRDMIVDISDWQWEVTLWLVVDSRQPGEIQIEGQV